MRLVQVGPVFFGIFVALACGSNADESKVGEGSTGATGNSTGTGTGTAASGNQLNTGNGSTTGSSSGGNGSVVNNENQCASISADGEAAPVDLYFMVDITGSMNCPVPDGGTPCDAANGPPATGDSRWTVVSSALKAFIADPQNQTLGVGMNFFPAGGGMMGGGNGGAACNVASYAIPKVGIGPLSMTAAPLTASIDMQRPNGTTPTVPSLTAAIDYATKWARDNPTHKVAVVYATDGQPNGCGGNNTVQQAATVAARGALGAMGAPVVPTYVLGVGPNLANLDLIAQNGGTKAAFLVDTAGNAASQLSAALASIRTGALSCTYSIPQPPKGLTFDDKLVNIDYTNGSGTVTSIGPTPNATDDCSTTNGWQYNTGKTQINLCGKACTDVKADKGGKLQVRFGCPTNPGEPPT